MEATNPCFIGLLFYDLLYCTIYCTVLLTDYSTYDFKHSTVLYNIIDVMFIFIIFFILRPVH